MAELQDSDITNLTVTGDSTLSDLTAPVAHMLCVSKNNGSSSDPTTGIDISWNVVHADNDRIDLTNNNERFTVIEPGYYYFAFRHISNNDSSAHNDLNKNGVRLVRSFAYWDTTPAMPSATYRSRMVSIIEYMDVGDYVTIYRATGPLFLANEIFITFLGFRISS